MDVSRQIEQEYLVKSIAYLLCETFEGSPDGQGSAYLDRGIGFLKTIDALSAAEVSREICETTIAAQTEHAKFYLDRLCEFMTGRTEAVNWEQSWLIETVNDEEWTALRGAVTTRNWNTVLRLLEMLGEA